MPPPPIAASFSALVMIVSRGVEGRIPRRPAIRTASLRALRITPHDGGRDEGRDIDAAAPCRGGTLAEAGDRRSASSRD